MAIPKVDILMSSVFDYIMLAADAYYYVKLVDFWYFSNIIINQLSKVKKAMKSANLKTFNIFNENTHWSRLI